MNIVLLAVATLGMTGGNAAESWTAAHFGKDVRPPFSFAYAGQPSIEFIGTWAFSHRTQRMDHARTRHVFTYSDPKTKLQARCECVVFNDFPAAEWVVKFKNEGSEETPILEGVQALDVAFTRTEQGDFVLHRAQGSDAARTDFAPFDDVLRPNVAVNLSGAGGRSSSFVALPFFNLESVGFGGVMLGIGWSGQWASSFVRDDALSLRVRAGMELTRLKLRPGEEIRTPRVLLLFWEGKDRLVGHNLLRRFLLAHHVPQKNGAPVTLPFACAGSPRYFDPSNKGAEFNDATEHNQVGFIDRYRQLGLTPDYWWIDAGWFEGAWPNGVGNWFVRKGGFPHGLRPVSDAAKKCGMGFVLWFEPERVYQGTWLDREHPAWVLKLPRNPNGLLNLGHPDARRWLTQHLSNMIDKEGISVLRQDFNIEPLAFWRSVDEPNRQGITEIRYMEGLYAVWDELLQKHPGLIIDNCASGGRRLDLETVSRSVALWRTDYQYYEPNGYQSHTYGINLYLPTTSTGSGSPDVYAFRSSMNNGVVLGWNLYQPGFPVEQARRLVDEFRRVRHFFFGDFYPLTPYSVTDDTWIAYQFHRVDLREGMVLAFRRPRCSTPSIRLRLKGLSPAARYEVQFEDRHTKATFTGEDLAKGVDVTSENAPGSLLITYRESL